MSLVNHGLSALMEACKQSERAEAETDSLFEAFNEAVDDDIKASLTGEDDIEDILDDSVENDMAGNGIGDDDAKMAELLKKIPPSDDGIEDQIQALSESLIPSDELSYIFS